MVSVCAMMADYDRFVEFHSGECLVVRFADLPDYAPFLKAQHDAFESEFRSIIAGLPIGKASKVLDLASGDGVFSRWFAEAGMNVLAVDLSQAFLKLAQEEVQSDGRGAGERVDLVQADFRRLPIKDQDFDLVWCAQSLYSLPEPREALGKMCEKVVPGGHVAVLENDEFHHILLPWPVEIELALCEAELMAHVKQSKQPRKFYVGRQLLELFHAVGLTDCQQRTWTFDRQAPLGEKDRAFFAWHLHDLRERIKPCLSSRLLDAFERLASPESESYMLNSPHFTATCVNFVISGVKSGPILRSSRSVAPERSG